MKPLIVTLCLILSYPSWGGVGRPFNAINGDSLYASLIALNSQQSLDNRRIFRISDYYIRTYPNSNLLPQVSLFRVMSFFELPDSKLADKDYYLTHALVSANYYEDSFSTAGSYIYKGMYFYESAKFDSAFYYVDEGTKLLNQEPESSLQIKLMLKGQLSIMEIILDIGIGNSSVALKSRFNEALKSAEEIINKNHLDKQRVSINIMKAHYFQQVDSSSYTDKIIEDLRTTKIDDNELISLSKLKAEWVIDHELQKRLQYTDLDAESMSELNWQLFKFYKRSQGYDSMKHYGLLVLADTIYFQRPDRISDVCISFMDLPLSKQEHALYHNLIKLFSQRQQHIIDSRLTVLSSIIDKRNSKFNDKTIEMAFEAEKSNSYSSFLSGLGAVLFLLITGFCVYKYLYVFAIRRS